MGLVAISLKENPPKSFPSNTEKNPKQCMVVTVRSGLMSPKRKRMKKNKLIRIR